VNIVGAIGQARPQGEGGGGERASP